MFRNASHVYGRVAIFAALGLLIVFLQLYIASLLFGSEAMTGLDGYYYLQQVKFLSEYGTLYYPSATPASLYAIFLFTGIFSDHIFGLKVFALTIDVCFCIGLFHLTFSLTKSEWLGVLSVFLVSISSLHLFFVVEFLNHLFSITALVWSGIALVKFYHSGKLAWLVLTILLLLLSVYSHRSILFLAIAASGLIMLAVLTVRSRPTTPLKRFIGLLFLVLCLVFLPILVVTTGIFELPEVLVREFRSSPQISFRRVTLMESILMLVAIVGFCSVFVWGDVEGDDNVKLVILGAIVFWSLGISFNPFLDHQGGLDSITIRLDFLLFVQIALSLPLLISLLRKPCSRYWKLLPLLAVPILSLRLYAILPIGVDPSYVERRARLITYLQRLDSYPCANPLIVAPHGDQFIVTYFLGTPSQQKLPLEFSGCILWLVHRQEFNRSDRSISLMESGELLARLSQMSRRQYLELRVINPHIKF